MGSESGKQKADPVNFLFMCHGSNSSYSLPKSLPKVLYDTFHLGKVRPIRFNEAVG